MYFTENKRTRGGQGKKQRRSGPKTDSQVDTSSPITDSNPADPTHLPTSDSEASDGEASGGETSDGETSDGEVSDSLLEQVAAVTEHAPQGEFESDDWDTEEANSQNTQVLYLFHFSRIFSFTL